VDLHPDLAPIAWLLGTWSGEGRGWYPTVADFAYKEDAVWAHVGKPFMAYQQATRATDDGRPLHGERGYLRMAGGQLELVVAHSNGIVEVAVGPVAETIVLRTTAVVGAPGAKEVTSIDRRIWREDGALRYELGMAAVGQPPQGHLEATLTAVT
jgi:hypothetical protein